MDCVHINDGAYRIIDGLCSILCLDRTKQTDQIKWFLSGGNDEFGLSELEKTNCQHYVSLDGDYIMAFDNNNRNQSTRIICYRIDEDAKTLDTLPARHNLAPCRDTEVQRFFACVCGTREV